MAEFEVKEFEVELFDRKRPIFIYGAGIFGEYTLAALKEHNLSPVCFCDRAKNGKSYLGLDIYDYNKIKEYDNPIVLLAVGAQFCDAWRFLEEKGVKELYSIYNLVFRDSKIPFEKLSLQAQDITYYEQLYLFGKKYNKDENKLQLYSLDWVITQKCSLRCRDCANLMQYYEKPVNIPTEQLIEDLNKVLQVVDEIMDLRVIGGEPFMNSAMAELIDAFLENPKIHNFSVYTNATILPDKKMIQILKHRKIKCEITDYGKIAKNKDKFIEIMEKEHIRYHIVKTEEWHLLGPLQNRKHTVDRMRQTFRNCYCNDNITLLKGNLYRCPYSAHGRELGAIPYKSEDVVRLDDSIEELRKQIRFLVFQKDFDYACGYCSGRNYHLGTVPPAIQVKEPLKYEKWDEEENNMA